MSGAKPKLKHCPFCGGPAVYQRMNESYHKEATWSAMCVYGHVASPDAETKEEAAEWWNRRSKRRLSTPSTN